jgi:hypothetical protein
MMPTVTVCDTRDWRNVSNLAGSSEHVTLVPLCAFLENDVHFQTPTSTKHITVPSWRYDITVYDVDFVFSISLPQIQLSLFDSLISPPPANLPSESAPIFQLSQHPPSLADRLPQPFMPMSFDPLSGTTIHQSMVRMPSRPTKAPFSHLICQPETHVHVHSQFAGYALPSPCELLARSVCGLENVPWHAAQCLCEPLSRRLSGGANFCVEP